MIFYQEFLSNVAYAKQYASNNAHNITQRNIGCYMKRLVLQSCCAYCVVQLCTYMDTQESQLSYNCIHYNTFPLRLKTHTHTHTHKLLHSQACPTLHPYTHTPYMYMYNHKPYFSCDLFTSATIRQMIPKRHTPTPTRCIR